MHGMSIDQTRQSGTVTTEEITHVKLYMFEISGIPLCYTLNTRLDVRRFAALR